MRGKTKDKKDYPTWEDIHSDWSSGKGKVSKP